MLNKKKITKTAARRLLGITALTGESLEMNSTVPNELPSPGKLEKRDIVATWYIPTKIMVHKVEFEHGTASGKRVLWIDGKEIFRRDWMFRLVGDDAFQLDDVRCVIRVDPASGFKYIYAMFVNGKSLTQYKAELGALLKVWETEVNEKKYRIVFEKSTLNIYMNGQLREEAGEFVDDGTDTEFEDGSVKFVLSARTSGNKREGLVHTLTANGSEIMEISIE